MSRLPWGVLVSFACVALSATTNEPESRADAPRASTLRFTREAAATDHPDASRVAADVLAQGGTAADAAAAAMLALGVVSPASSGFGGGGFALYYRASDRSTTFLDFRERAPAASTPTMFEDAERERPGSHPSEVGGLAVGVPGEPAGIEMLVQRFGRLPLRQVVEPAVRLARRGVSPSAYVSGLATPPIARDLRRDARLRAWFGASGPDALDARRPLRQRGLASVLRAFGQRGSAAIYRGAIARAIVRDVRAHGGILTEQDLADYRVVERTPLRERHFGYDFVTAPPPSAGGATLLASLDFLERAGISASTPADAVEHALLESWKGPFLDRQVAFGDPDHVDVPLPALATDARRAARFARFDPARAVASEDYALPIEPAAVRAVPHGGGTTHLCVVDRQGNVAAVTTTVNLQFGARFTAGGILMNDEMDDFARAVGQPNAFGLVGGERNRPGPGRRPVSSMTPTLVFGTNGAPVLCIGAAGGSRIPTATTQVALAILVRAMPEPAAISAPRVHHQGVPATAFTERLVPATAATLDALRARGHALNTMEMVAVVQLVRIAPDGTLWASSDPRKGGAPAGR